MMSDAIAEWYLKFIQNDSIKRDRFLEMLKNKEIINQKKNLLLVVQEKKI